MKKQHHQKSIHDFSVDRVLSMQIIQLQHAV
jgi:hypothetical protein